MSRTPDRHGLASGGVAVPATPIEARSVFGSRLVLAEAYVALLADTGISHGLIGPREAPRLWDRHVLNSAVAQPVFDEGARVADIGSGAGLPGIPLAIARPDLQLTLVEPLLRRSVWLNRAVEELGLANVEVYRGRAESLWGTRRFRHVTARAVARAGELARLTLPLLEAGGSLHALKGENALAELEEDAARLRSLGASRWVVSRFGAGVVDPETVVVTVEVDFPVVSQGFSRAASRRGSTGPSRRGSTGSSRGTARGSAGGSGTGSARGTARGSAGGSGTGSGRDSASESLAAISDVKRIQQDDLAGGC